jgi:hypothetical protein
MMFAVIGFVERRYFRDLHVILDVHWFQFRLSRYLSYLTCTGKTTSAASLALGLADSGMSVLVLSTDPAHSLGDALQQPLSGAPARVDLCTPYGTFVLVFLYVLIILVTLVRNSCKSHIS